jgi:8-oxo-dGTP pyrophosphatase MutT (NUDIX family)
MKKFRILSREMLVDDKFCKIEKQIVKLPNGKMGKWFINLTCNAVLIVPIKKNGEVLLQKSYKHGCGEIVTEFCAGMIDDGESVKDAAERELLEETGYVAERLIKVGENFSDPTGSKMKYHFFVALNVEKTNNQELEDEEQIEVFTVKNLKKVGKLLTDSEIKTSSGAISALKFAEKYFDKKS